MPDSVSLVVISTGADDLRLLADRVAASVCRSLAAAGRRAEVEVLELRRLAGDLARHAATDEPSLDLREAVAVVAVADGLVVATPCGVLASFFDVLEPGIRSGLPLLLVLGRARGADLDRAAAGFAAALVRRSGAHHLASNSKQTYSSQVLRTRSKLRKGESR